MAVRDQGTQREDVKHSSAVILASKLRDRLLETHGDVTREARIRIIMRLMTECLWVTGETGLEMAEVFGLAPVTIRDDSAEASRRIKAEVSGDREEMRARILAGFETALRIAREQANSIAMTKALAEIRDTFGLGIAAESADAANIVDPLLGLSSDELQAVIAGGRLPDR